MEVNRYKSVNQGSQGERQGARKSGHLRMEA